MGHREEDTVRAFLDARMEGDIKRTLTFLAKDAEYRIPAWNEPIQRAVRNRGAWPKDCLGDTATSILYNQPSGGGRGSPVRAPTEARRSRRRANRRYLTGREQHVRRPSMFCGHVLLVADRRGSS
jgi:hypothetical protein